MKLHLSLLVSTFVGAVCSLQSAAIPTRKPPSTEINYALHHRSQPYRHRSNEAIALYESSEIEQNKPQQQKEYFDWNKQWYPILPISYLDDDKPVSITVVDKDLVVWRNKSGDSHDVSVFLDCCPHRMAPLSTGKIVKDEETGSYNIACRYHGFEFDAIGVISKIPMMIPPADGRAQSSNLSKKVMCARAYPTRTYGGLVYAFFGEFETEEDLPDIPMESIASKAEIDNANWIFNVNPISYQGMMENTFDPTHAPFTHEGMSGFAGIPFSPDDIVPMEKFEASNFGIGGFTMSHTPYQLYTAQRGGFDTETQRIFTPPCTISVKSPPFFQTKMWFVPSTATSMHVIAIMRRPPPTRIIKIVKFLDKTGSVSGFLDDVKYAKQYLSDYSYRFQSQDRITMQGQDKRKWKLDMSQCLDLAPTVSDNGVATFQKWMQRFGGLGPFPFSPRFKETSAEDLPDFDRELSIWDSHGKFNPKMKRILQSILKLQKISEKCAKVSLGALVTTALLPIIRRKVPAIPIIVSLIVSIGLIDWTRGLQRRFYGKGDETWQKSLLVWGS